MIGSPLQVCQNNHQDSEATINCQIHLELYTTYISLPTSSCFDSDGVALKNIVKYFLQQSHEEREYDEKLRHYLNEQIKSIKELGDHNTNLHKTGAHKSGMAEYVFYKHTLGDSDNES
ncbi:Ferritin heavy chain [Camelus dromedarius]|uniref:Ferritin n=1 Tax=Camelus dromedarius TaxID=9838 RepID=A0A5N4D8X6_CAMDR|nr:hypothetical protein CB1_001525017 [Camelus ferus]KAB1267578.1 Ferritin heavy chain [Camelus dromedarius]